ncbi:MAG: hypothetical protein ACXVY8_06275 [Gaiellaceae bacterium]
MTRLAWTGVTTVAVAVALFAATSVVSAAPAGQLCPSFKKSGLKYQFETLGSGYSCSSAKGWIDKLSGDRVPVKPGHVPLHNGPKGLHCFATAELKGHASSGACYKGTLAFPGPGFTWIGS